MFNILELTHADKERKLSGDYFGFRGGVKTFPFLFALNYFAVVVMGRKINAYNLKGRDCFGLKQRLIEKSVGFFDGVWVLETCSHGGSQSQHEQWGYEKYTLAKEIA